MIEYGNKFDSIFEYLILRFGTDSVKKAVTEELPYLVAAFNVKETCRILEEFSEWISIEMFGMEEIHITMTEDFKSMVMFKLL